MYRVKELNILLNNFCNLRCSYCHFREDNHKNFIELPLSHVTKAIDLFVTASQKHPEDYLLCFNADGELFLSKQLLSAGIEHAISLREKFNCNNIKIAIVTNGTLLDEPMVTFLARHKVAVTISIDGPAIAHDKHRRDKNDKPTYGKIMSNLKQLQLAGVPVSVRAVVTPDTIIYLDKVYEELRKINPIELIKIRPKRSMQPPFFTPDWVELFTNRMMILVNKLLKDNTPILELPDDIYHFAAFLLHRKGRQRYCGAGHNMLWLTPSGFFATCGLLTNSSQLLEHIDSIKQKKDFCGLLEHPTAQSFRGKISMYYKPCFDCVWYKACLGGCPAFSTLADKITTSPLCNYYKYIGTTLKKGLNL